MALLMLGILWLCVRGDLAALQHVTTYPEHQQDLQNDVVIDVVEDNSQKGNNVDVLVAESRTEYDISVFVKMLKQKKKMIPTRPAYVMFY